MSSLRQPVGPRSPATYWRRRASVLALVLVLLYLPVRACADSSPSGGGTKNQARPAPAVPSRSASPGPTGAVIQEPGGGPSGRTSGAAGGTSGGSAVSGGAGGTGTGGTGHGQDGNGTDPVGAGRGLVPAGQDRPPAKPGEGGGPRDCSPGDFKLVTRTDERAYGGSANPRFTLTVQNVGTKSCQLDVGQNAAELLVTSGGDRVWSSTDCARRQSENVQSLRPGGSLLLMQVGWERSRSMRGCPAGLPRAKAGTYVLTGNLRGLSSSKDVFDLR